MSERVPDQEAQVEATDDVTTGGAVDSERAAVGPAREPAEG